MNFFEQARIVSESPRHLNALSDLGGLLFNGRIRVLGPQVLDKWLVLPIRMRFFWGKRLRNEIWDLARFCASEEEIRALLDSVKNGKPSDLVVFEFKHRILERIGI